MSLVRTELQDQLVNEVDLDPMDNVDNPDLSVHQVSLVLKVLSVPRENPEYLESMARKEPLV